MKKVSLSIVIILLFTVVPATVFTQSLNTKKLDSLFASLSRNNKAMGSIAIYKDGKPVYSKAIGISHETDSVKPKATVKTKYRIGTASQMITAAMVMKLVEQKKIKLDDQLVNYIPDVPNSHLITIIDLLQHRSGIYDYLKDTSITNNLDKPMSREKFMEVVSSKLPEYSAGYKQEFNNGNYILLGYIIEDLTKKPFATAFRELIADSLGLKNLYYSGRINPSKLEAHSFLWENNEWVRAAETDPSVLHASGAMVSTADDLAKFTHALFNEKILTRDNFYIMVGPSDEYGFSILSFKFGGAESYGLIGSIDGFMAASLHQPDSGLTVTYLSNGQNLLIEEVLEGVYNICFNNPYVVPDFKPYPLTLDQMKEFVGTYSYQGSPLRLDIRLRGKQLFSKLTVQDESALFPTEKNKFMYEKGGVRLEFSPDKQQVTLIQAGEMYVFTRQ